MKFRWYTKQGTVILVGSIGDHVVLYRTLRTMPLKSKLKEVNEKFKDVTEIGPNFHKKIGNLLRTRRGDGTESNGDVRQIEH